MRDTYLDTSKGLLISFVVLGHFLEEWIGWTTAESRAILATIYTFHMPAFIFVSGMFFKDKDLSKKIIYFLSLLIPFHILYVMTAWILRGEISPSSLVMPFWIMWYIAGMIAWTLITHYLKKTKIPVLIAITLSVVIGLSPINNYYFSIGRIFVFLPFFVIGAIYGHQIVNYVKRKVALLYSAPLIFIGLILYYYHTEISKYWLYGSYSYKQLETDLITGVFTRLALLGASFVTIISFIAITKIFENKLVALGQHTLPVYLLHGFVILTVVSLVNLPSSPYLVLICSIVATLITCLVLKQDIFNTGIKSMSNKLMTIGERTSKEESTQINNN